MTNTKDESIIYGFKAFGKGLICQDKRYEVGKTYKENGKTICQKGMMHFCQVPFDIFNYYPLLNNKAEIIDFCRVSSPKTKTISGGDKSASTELTIVDKITLKDLINNQVSVLSSVINEAHSATTGYWAHSATTGYKAHSATTGDEAHSATTGYKAHSATTGDEAHSATTGDWAHSATTGYKAHSATTGYKAHSATTGDEAHSATTGYKAHSATTGNNSIAVALGNHSMASASIGSWIVLAEYDDNGNIRFVKTAQIDGEKLKPNVLYTLKNGRFVKGKE